MEVKELSYDTAYRAVHGDHDAQMKVLEYYDSYIRKAKTGKYVFVTADITFVDAIENLRFGINMQ